MTTKLKDLAHICKVDVSTISRALRDDPRVKLATREKIKSKAIEFGYTPNIAARNLVTGKTNQIAMIINGLYSNLETEIANEISQKLIKEEKDLVLLQHFGKKNILERHLGRLNKSQFDGAIIIPAGIDEESEIINTYTPSNIPIVLVDRYPHNPKLPTVTSNNYQGAIDLVNSFSGIKIDAAIAFFHQKNQIQIQRLKGVEQALKSHDIPLFNETNFEKQKKMQHILLLSNDGKKIYDFVTDHSSFFQNKKILAGCFDYWATPTDAFLQIKVCEQNFPKIAHTAFKLITKSYTKATIKEIDTKGIIVIKQ